MTLWHTVLLASIIVLALKLAGYSVPAAWFAGERRSRVLELTTISLLAALAAVQTLGQGESIVVDARVPAMAVAMLMFWAKVPFIVVIIAAALTAAALRALGLAG
ncbi:AzlD domain-containing protein [Agrococcus casei]|uniref:AzlD domain-containing protein n=1 Tax=Agrococcus casei TaxID=343512 RepID=UPI003F8E5E5D